MAKVHGDIVIDIEKCKGCELCVTACPQGSLRKSTDVNSKGYLYIVKIEDNCTGCQSCAMVCPDGAITVYRKSKEGKTPIAKITNITEDIKVTVEK